MYKNLSPAPLGISGRQSELIELALTHGFRSIDVDVEELAKKAQNQGIEQANRFLSSAQLKVGSFEVPIKWRGEESTYKAEMIRLDALAKHVSSAGGDVCHVTVYPANDSFPYHENFELHRKRLGEMGALVGKHNLDLGVGYLAAAEHRENREFQFVHEAEALATLIKSIAADNVGLYLDTWNWHLGGGTIEQLESLGVQRIKCVSLADIASDAPADAISDNHRVLPVVEDGQIDIAQVLRILKDGDFKGPVSMQPCVSSIPKMPRERVAQHVSKLFDDLLQSTEVVEADAVAD